MATDQIVWMRGERPLRTGGPCDPVRLVASFWLPGGIDA